MKQVNKSGVGVSMPLARLVMASFLLGSGLTPVNPTSIGVALSSSGVLYTASGVQAENFLTNDPSIDERMTVSIIHEISRLLPKGVILEKSSYEKVVGAFIESDKNAGWIIFQKELKKASGVNPKKIHLSPIKSTFFEVHPILHPIVKKHTDRFADL